MRAFRGRSPFLVLFLDYCGSHSLGKLAIIDEFTARDADRVGVWTLADELTR